MNSLRIKFISKVESQRLLHFPIGLHWEMTEETSINCIIKTLRKIRNKAYATSWLLSTDKLR